jgi:hypothetical protein
MHDWLAILKWLPRQVLVPQLGLSSSMSKGVLLNDLFPVIVFPTEPTKIVRPPNWLLLVVLAETWLLFEPRVTVIKKIPPLLSLAVLLTIMLLLLSAIDTELLTSFSTKVLLLTSNKTMPAVVAPGPRTTFPWSIHWPPGGSISIPSAKPRSGQFALTLKNFTEELAEFAASKPSAKLLIVPEPRTFTFVSMGPDENMEMPKALSQVPAVAVPVMVCPANCNVTLLAEMSIPSTPGAHGPTSVASKYVPG